MTSTLREGVCVYVCVCDVGDGGGKAYSLDVQSLFLLLKKIEFAPWPALMLSQTLICYWQEIFLLTHVSDSEAIL